ncbi:MAG: N-acetyltransferase [Gammaproteobacteria bacterium]|jgi:putative acetyltransferase
MNETIVLLDERAGDRESIHEVTRLAFAGRPYAGGDEQDVVDRLRAAGALALSLVALQGIRLVGQVTFSPAEQADSSAGWFALGPVSVLPEWQGQGVGASLIEAGLARLIEMQASGCILTGDPNYYGRFGFKVRPELCPDNEPGEFFQLKCLAASEPTGTFSFHPAFYGG